MSGEAEALAREGLFLTVGDRAKAEFQGAELTIAQAAGSCTRRVP
ncbi:hypothetical protein OHA10_36890 [Kribbella sp. NBC_00662]